MYFLVTEAEYAMLPSFEKVTDIPDRATEMLEWWGSIPEAWRKLDTLAAGAAYEADADAEYKRVREGFAEVMPPTRGTDV